MCQDNVTGCRARQPVAVGLANARMSRTTGQRKMRQCLNPICLVVALAIGSVAARAEVRVEGTPAALRVSTSQDKIADVLSAFTTALNVQYRSAIPLDATAGATYSGSLGQVLTRLLDGYNYVVKREAERTEVVVFGVRGEVAIPPPKPPPPKSFASQWR
jgi:hypothetical protein